MKRLLLLFLIVPGIALAANKKGLREGFIAPPDSVRPGVYWYFMDGCLSEREMTADLESMKQVGIGSVLFLEVNLGLPRGRTNFRSPQWRQAFQHAVSECERLGMEMILGVGPGWNGSGGPWVDASESMRHLVGSETVVRGDGKTQRITLEKPAPRSPFFGEGVFTPELRERWLNYYEDVCVIAFPENENTTRIDKIDEKALYYRAPFSSAGGVPPVLPEPAPDDGRSTGIDTCRMVDLTGVLKADGTLEWNVPAGNWRILRLGMRNNGAVSRPAPTPGLGFECDKFDSAAFSRHFDNAYGAMLREARPSAGKRSGLKGLHMDSWEMGSQNWSGRFAEEFERRRGYAPGKFLPVLQGYCVVNREVSERFLHDLRKTAEELIIEQHARVIAATAHRYGMRFSIEPYDMTPLSDIRLCEQADVPMCEFWTPKNGFNTTYGCFEATSVAHVLGRPTVAAEAFTTNSGEGIGFANHPGSIKAQGDWAFAAGINRFYYHTFVHKYFEHPAARPGMTMSGYGVNWDRGQTWWHLSDDYHKYVARCSFLLSQGRTIADILYLTGEDAPYVFKHPASAVEGVHSFLPDRRGFNFDACSPATLQAKARIEHGHILFESGASYRLIVLPQLERMTPRLLRTIRALLLEGGTVIGNPPSRSPSLTGYPDCDEEVAGLAAELWGDCRIPDKPQVRKIGRGRLIWGGDFSQPDGESLYPTYQTVAELLRSDGLQEDFTDSAGGVRYTHRACANQQVYFLSNRTGSTLHTQCRFRTQAQAAELWDPLTGKMYALPATRMADGTTCVDLRFEPDQSFFVVFSPKVHKGLSTFDPAPLEGARRIDLSRDWEVSFDPAWGGPEKVHFPELTDWSLHPEESVRHYSGSAIYRKTVELNPRRGERTFIEFGNICHLARVRINGHIAATLWTTPWQVEITDFIRNGSNCIEIEAVNLWVNRLIGDASKPYDGVGDDGQWPAWLSGGQARTSGRYSYATFDHYTAQSPLVASGIIGPACIYIK